MNKKVEVTEEDLEKLLNVFQQFNVDSVWSKVTSRNDFHSKRFKFGYINDLFCCELTDEARERFGLSSSNDHNSKVDDDYPVIVVKFLAKNFWLEIDRLELAIINTIVSQQGISPKLLLIKDYYQVNQCIIKSRSYNNEDDCDDQTVKQLARLLAQLHSIRPIPISNAGYNNWVEMSSNTKNGLINLLIDAEIYIQKNEDLKKKYYDFIVKMDMKTECEFTKELIDKLDSPLVFSHNDFNRHNRLISFNEANHKQIHLIDFDYANFNNRGYDLGRYFSNYRHHEDLFGNEGFPTDDEMNLFLEEYRRELASKHSPSWLEDPQNSIEHLRDEAKIFALFSYLTDCWFSITMILESPETEHFLIITKTRYEGYQRLKQMFTEDGTIAKIFSRN